MKGDNERMTKDELKTSTKDRNAYRIFGPSH